ncbi:MAG TPA: hypothetical protein VMA13_08050 [Candidatus Saccharimonadales bacterium]|nr:hypothetical protein [Candidatus Saccharimonadales bacterium]
MIKLRKKVYFPKTAFAFLSCEILPGFNSPCWPFGVRALAGTISVDRQLQRFKFKRLADDGINAAQWAFRTLKFLRKGCQHYNRLLGRTAFDGGGQLIAFHAWHEVVRENHVKLAWFEQGQCIVRIQGAVNNVTIVLKKHLDALADGGFIVHDQYMFLPSSTHVHHPVKPHISCQPLSFWERLKATGQQLKMPSLQHRATK